MKYFVFLCCIISMFSCKKSYPEWDNFFLNIESSVPYTYLPDTTNIKNSFEKQLKFVLSTNTRNLDAEILSILDESIKIFVLAKQNIEEEKYQKVIELILPIVSRTSKTISISEQILYHEANLLYIDALLYSQNLNEAHEKLQDTHKLTNIFTPLLHKYYSVRYLALEATYLYNTSHYKYSQAACHYALYLIENYLPEFKNLYNTIILVKTTGQFTLGNEYLQLVYENLLYLKEEYHNNPDVLSKINSDLISYYGFKGDKAKIDYLLESGFQNFEGLSIKQQNYLIISALYYYNIFAKPDEIKKSLSLIDKYNTYESEPCVRNNYVFKLYIANAYMKNSKTLLADSTISSVKVPDICTPRLKKLIKFYVLQMKYAIVGSDAEHGIEVKIEILLESRNLASEIYTGGEELHLEDYYAQNLHAIFTLLHNKYGQNIPEQYHFLLLELVNDTRKREWNRELNLAKSDVNLQSTAELNEANYQIREGLRKCNDFLRTDSLGATFYRDLYIAYQSKEQLIKLMGAETIDHSKFSANLLKKEIIETRNEILDIQHANNQYWLLFYDGNFMQIEKHAKSLVDSLISNYVNILSSSTKNIDNEEAKIFQLSIFNALNKDKKLTVLTDGKFSQLPFDAVDSAYIVSPTLEAILQRDSMQLKSEKSSLIAFSDNATRKSRKVQPVSELYHDYEECLDIYAIVKKKGNFWHGNSATKMNLDKSMKGDLLHLATHAIADTLNRLNSHFYLREKQNATPEKVYLSYLYSFERTPAFVNLSTCVSAIGTQVSGQGTFSLSRPFFTKGSQTVLKTLWFIDDKFNRYFMRTFYNYWINGNSISQAFEKTKTEIKTHNVYAHPYYWSGFVLEGNPNLYLQ